MRAKPRTGGVALVLTSVFTFGLAQAPWQDARTPPEDPASLQAEWGTVFERGVGKARIGPALPGHPQPSVSVELLSNGDFETGTFDGWTVSDLPGSAGTFHIDTPGTTAPVTGNPTAPNPGGGAFYAVTAMSGAGTHALSQSFTVPTEATQVLLSFEMFVDDWSGLSGIVHPGGLDHTVPTGNQHARVDILSAGAPPFDTGAGVLLNVYIGADPSPSVPNPYTPYVFDISSVAVPGGTYVVRFASTENLNVLHQGVDNVSVVSVETQCNDGVVDPPETCEPPGGAACDCCVENGTPGCTSPLCEAAVCDFDSFCCTTDWDDVCVEEALLEPACIACCNATCRNDCTYCGDGIVQQEQAEQCELPGTPVPTGDCCVDNATPGCSSPICETLVCSLAPSCCTVAWDGACVLLATESGCCPGVCQPGSCCADGDGDGACDDVDTCTLTPNPQGSSDCCTANGTPGCSDPACESTICAVDPFCCSGAWDAGCADAAILDPACLATCGGSVFSQTILAPDKTSLAWPAPEDVVWVSGPLEDVSAYLMDAGPSTVAAATAIPAVAVPLPGQGRWWLVRPDCPAGSWTSNGYQECNLFTCGINRDGELP